MSRHTYYLEFCDPTGTWFRPAGAKVPRLYGEGYLSRQRELGGPRLAARLVRDDGRVVDEVGALPDASIGMVAGLPTPAQYRAAAARAIAQAERLEAREAARAARRAP